MYKAHGNHKPKIYKRYTRMKEKGIQTQHYRKSSTYNRRKQENKKGTEKNYKNNQKTINGDNYIPINNYFICKWIKCFNQKTNG